MSLTPRQRLPRFPSIHGFGADAARAGELFLGLVAPCDSNLVANFGSRHSREV